MADLKFGMLDLVAGQLDKHKERLGPLHRPLVMLLGAALFVLFLALLIGAPIVWMEDFVYVALLQVFLVAVFFMLLLTIPLNVYDRFVFSMAVFVVLSAAPIMITTGFFFAMLEPGDPAAFAAATRDAKPEIFLYSLMRGIGQMAFALPLLFGWYTFQPWITGKGEQRERAAINTVFWTALALHALATFLHLWLGGSVKVFAPLDAANAELASEIHGYQMTFLSLQVIYLLLGFATVIAARYASGGRDRRFLAIVVTGMLLVQACYLVSSHFNRQMFAYYPAARSSAGFTEAYRDKASGQFVFTLGRPNTISPVKFAAFRSYATCENPERGRFTLKVGDREVFEAQHTEVSLARVPAAQKFCQPPETPP